MILLWYISRNTDLGHIPSNDELKELMENDEPYCAIQYEGEQHKAQELIKANGMPADHLIDEDEYDTLSEKQAQTDKAAAEQAAIDSGAANVANSVAARYDNRLASGNY